MGIHVVRTGAVRRQLACGTSCPTGPRLDNQSTLHLVDISTIFPGGLQYPNGPSIAALETCLASAALTDASAATRCWAVPRLRRCCTFATPEAERSTPRFLRCRSSALGSAEGSDDAVGQR